MDAELQTNIELSAAMDVRHAAYADERDAHISPEATHRPTGGVAGTTGGVKCLHAHYGDHAAGNDNPIGALVAPWVEPLTCTTPCVSVVAGVTVRNPDWIEPK